MRLNHLNWDKILNQDWTHQGSLGPLLFPNSSANSFKSLSSFKDRMNCLTTPLACVAGGILLSGVLFSRQSRHARRGSTSTVIPPARQATSPPKDAIIWTETRCWITASIISFLKTLVVGTAGLSTHFLPLGNWRSSNWAYDPAAGEEPFISCPTDPTHLYKNEQWLTLMEPPFLPVTKDGWSLFMNNDMRVKNTLDVVIFIFYCILQACISFCTSHRGNNNSFIHLHNFDSLYTTFSQRKDIRCNVKITVLSSLMQCN